MDKEIKERIAAINSGIIPDGYKKTKVGIVPVEWEECHFKKMFSRLKRKNTESNTNVLTISAQYGLINQEEFFNKSVASDDKSNYYLLYKGDFAYNKSYSNGYPFGAIKALEKYEKGVVSPLYICFSPTVENKCPDYYLQYFESGNMNREIQAIAQEGARNHGLLNIGIDDFFNSYLVVPPLPEQQKIAEILSTQDKLIELQEKKIEQLKVLKKAYLQKMFPKKGSKYPELRFKGFTDPWEQRKLGDYCDMYNGDRSSKYPNVQDMVSDGIPFINAGDLENGRVILSSCNKISKEKYDNLGGAKLQLGDIVYCLRGTLGKNAYIDNFTEGTVASSLVAIRPKNINGRYMFHVINSDIEYRQRIVHDEGAAQPNLSAKNVSEFLIPIPNIDEQKMIAKFLDNLTTLIPLHQRKSEQEKQKKKALMQLLLTGIVRTK